MRPQYCTGQRRDGSPCGRRLFDLDEGALAPRKQLAIKCRDCNHTTTLTGSAA